MDLTFTLSGTRYSADLHYGTDCCIPIKPYASSEEQKTQCFHLPAAEARPFTAGSFVASVSAGASINCPVVSSMCFHSNGTHTECVGHALPGNVTLLDVFAGSAGPFPGQVLVPALLLSVSPQRLKDTTEVYPPGQPDDLVIVGSALEAAAGAAEAAAYDRGLSTGVRPFLAGFTPPHAPKDKGGEGLPVRAGGALLIRTLPNDGSKRGRNWSGSNPPYLTPSAMRWALAHGCTHILCDLPSADREDDQGQLLAHRTWWGLPPRGTEAQLPWSTRTITELCFIPGPPDPAHPALHYWHSRLTSATLGSGEEQSKGMDEAVWGSFSDFVAGAISAAFSLFTESTESAGGSSSSSSGAGGGQGPGGHAVTHEEGDAGAEGDSNYHLAAVLAAAESAARSAAHAATQPAAHAAARAAAAVEATSAALPQAEAAARAAAEVAARAAAEAAATAAGEAAAEVAARAAAEAAAGAASRAAAEAAAWSAAHAAVKAAWRVAGDAALKAASEAAANGASAAACEVAARAAAEVAARMAARSVSRITARQAAHTAAERALHEAGIHTTPAPAPVRTAGVSDGPYLLNLCVAPIAMDAAPSRPLLYPVRLAA